MLEKIISMNWKWIEIHTAKKTNGINFMISPA
jgi:hypothetical protein